MPYRRGKDWRKVILMDALTNKIMEDTIIDVKLRFVLERKRRLYYSSYDKPRKRESAKTDQHKLYFHKMGTSRRRTK
jgi:prolyl oligopeptidase